MRSSVLIPTLVIVLGMALPEVARAQFAGNEPPVVMQLSPSGIRSLNQEFDDDFQALDAFGGQRKDRFLRSIEPRPKYWTFYGRLGLINFQNELKDQSSTRFTLRRSGPKLTGKIYVGIHRRF